MPLVVNDMKRKKKLPLKRRLLLIGSSDGEIFLWDLNDETQKLQYRAKSSKLSDITSLAWNPELWYILAATSSNGNTVIWNFKDLKTKKTALEAITLTSPVAKQTTAVAWNPFSSTQLITASEDDREPSLQIWDLRNARAPVKTLSGHTKGVLSLSWSPYDPNLLLSCGKVPACNNPFFLKKQIRTTESSFGTLRPTKPSASSQVPTTGSSTSSGTRATPTSSHRRPLTGTSASTACRRPASQRLQALCRERIYF